MNPFISGLEGKVVLVTGGASGIGLASAQALAASGAKVVCADLQQSQDLPQGCEFRKLDVSSEKLTNELVAYMLERYGQIDGLVTSAGISRVGDLQSMPLQALPWPLMVTTRAPSKPLRVTLGPVPEVVEQPASAARARIDESASARAMLVMSAPCGCCGCWPSRRDDRRRASIACILVIPILTSPSALGSQLS